MDPNATLALIRENIGIVIDGDESDGADATSLVGETLEAMRNLDEWLSNGGFLPTDWMR